MSRQIDRKGTMQVRIDAGLHKLLKIKAAGVGKSMKELLEGCLSELLAIDGKYSEDY